MGDQKDAIRGCAYGMAISIALWVLILGMAGAIR